MKLHRQLDNRSRPGTVAPTPQLRRLGRFLTGASVLLICAATLTPQAGHSENSPFCIICGSLGGVDAALNVLLFLPLGIGLSLSGVRATRALLAILLFSASIEVAQFLVISGRDSALGDVLTNVAGGVIGFELVHGFDIWRNPSRRATLALSFCWIVAWLGIQLLSSYAFAPAFPTTRYYGQIARVFENMAAFHGQVLSATIDTVAVPNFGFAKTRQFHNLLEEGAVVGAVVIPAGPTPRIAPIIRVADDRRRQIVLLGQDRADMVFGVHTGAVNLRLRPPLFRLRGVFPRGDRARLLMSDTMELQARYRATGVEMRAASRGAAQSRHMVISSALAWILVLPRQWYVEGTRTELLLNFLWLATLLLPLGYWGFFAATSDRARAARAFVAATALLAIVLAIGLVLLPRSFGLQSESVGDWLAAVGGIVVGAALGRARQESRSQVDHKTPEEGGRSLES